MTITHDLVLFDLDGTLSDPLEVIARSINHALSHFGHAPMEHTDLAAYIGPPLDETFRSIAGLSNDSDINAYVARYRERYADIGYAENVLYAGVPEALRRLGEAGIPMAVCTSKRSDFAEKILVMFGLRQHFRFVSGGDVGVQKWQQMASLCAKGMASPASIMVGDRAVDMVAAHGNGLKAAGVLWGFGSREELAKETPLYLFGSPVDLATLAVGLGT